MERKPEILVFAGPNGSGKSTITELIEVVGEYVNADDIQRTTGCTNMEAALLAEKRRNDLLQQKRISHLRQFYQPIATLSYCKKQKMKDIS